ncbi:hypothetical protein [Pigmentiphaga humi]|nr:hypothetical protein [Pigmentiphaga humi]
MIEDLDLLASRISQLTALTQSLRDENAALGKSLAQRDAHIHMLRETLASAQTRVDQVLARLPAEPAEEAEGEAEAAEDDSSTAADGAEPGARSLYGTP